MEPRDYWPLLGERLRQVPKKTVLGWILFLLFLTGYAAIQSWILLASNFYAYLNDFWFLRKLGADFTGTNPAVLQDGFFPYLYPILQRLIPDDVALQTSSVASLLASVGTILLVFMAARRLVGSAWALLSVWFTALEPSFFAYAGVAGADALSVLFIAAALLAMTYWIKGNHNGSPWILLVAGVFIAVGGSLRHHVLILAVLPIAGAVMATSRRTRSILAAAGGILIGYSPQMVVNLLAGEGPYATLQGFNVYRVVVGVDWNTTPSLNPELYTSPIRIITGYPYEFATTYLQAWQAFSLPLLTTAVAVLVTQQSRWRRITWPILVAALLYAGLTSLAYSERTMIAIVPLWAFAIAVSAGFLARWLWSVHRGTHNQRSNTTLLPMYLVTFLGALAVTLPWLQENVIYGKERIALEDVRFEQELALRNFAEIKHMNEVFSNDFNIYALEISGGAPSHIGGIGPVSQPGRVDFSGLDLSTVESFLCSAQSRGITTVIWNPGATSGVPLEVSSLLVRLEVTGLTRAMLGGDLIAVRLPQLSEEVCEAS